MIHTVLGSLFMEYEQSKQNKQMKRLFIVSIAVILFHSCVFIRKDDSIDLGNKYRYVQDAPKTIIYHESVNYKGTGKEIVPPIVLSYEFNDRYIIAKTQEVDEMTGSKENRPIHYWIVDKTTNGATIEPMDSITFYQRLLELDIKMFFH